MLIDILINRLCIIPLEILPKKKNKVNNKKKLTFLIELAGLGYVIDNPEMFNDTALNDYDNIIKTLKKIKGGNVKYVPLFQGFPNDVPEENEYFVKRIIGFLGNFIGLYKEGTKLDNGIYIPNWLFDINEFGADPITQFQDKTLYNKGIISQWKRKQDTHIEWIHLKLVSNQDAKNCARKYLQNILYAKSSIKEALKSDIEFLLNFFETGDIDVSKIVFKETKTYLTKYYWLKDEHYEIAKNCIDTPTDLLRLFASLTDSDISLSQKIKFPKFTRSQRRFIISCLEYNMSNLIEDMNTYKGLWLALGKSIHVGEYKEKAPKTFAAFNILRNEKFETFNSKVENAIDKKNIDTLLNLLISRPGIFARKLHQILEISGKNNKKVLTSFKTIVNKVVLKNLLVMEKYFKTIENSDYRTIINKRGKIRVMDNTKNRVSNSVITSLLSIIKKAITEKISIEKDSWNNKDIWIDKSLKNYTIPLQQRTASDGLMTIGRGSRIPLDMGKVLRLFVYWKQASVVITDLDLSIIEYDENMKYLGNVSYTNLAGDGIIHSGDIQSAPHGSAEFIDINLERIKNKKTKYIATQIYKYSGDNFSDLSECYSGWMIRDEINKNYKSFDIKTVQNKFDLNGACAYSIPIIVDIETNEIIFIDLYVGQVTRHNRVQGAHEDISIISREMIKMSITKPNMYDLALYNVKGRKGIVINSKKKADITIGLKDCDYNVNEIEKTLSELI